MMRAVGAGVDPACSHGVGKVGRATGPATPPAPDAGACECSRDTRTRRTIVRPDRLRPGPGRIRLAAPQARADR